MSDHRTATILAFLIIGGFFLLMVVILSGQVNMKEPTTAEIVGALFGYLTALMNPIIARYFRERPNPPDQEIEATDRHRPLLEGNEP